MRPSSALGCWYNSSYVVSSELKWLSHGVSASQLWINRVAPETANDFTLAGMRWLFKFYNSGQGAAQQLTVADAPRPLYPDVAGAAARSAEAERDLEVARAMTARERPALEVIEVPPPGHLATAPRGIDDTYVSLLPNGVLEDCWRGGEEDDEGEELPRRFEFNPEYVN